MTSPIKPKAIWIAACCAVTVVSGVSLFIAACDAGDVYYQSPPELSDQFVFETPDGGVEFNFDGNTCAAQAEAVKLIPVDLALILDTSGSMDYPLANSKWSNVRFAIKNFVADERFVGQGVGLQFFPKRFLCSVDAYRDFVVPFVELPDEDEQIAIALDNKEPGGGTPMAPVMEAAIIEARSRANANPDRRIVVVLATDGIPDDTCQVPGLGGSFSNTLQNVVSIVADGFNGGPEGTEVRLRTFVIGVGDELTALNDIAAAGGTEEAILVDTEGDVQNLFANALNEIRRQAVTCEYDIPPPERGELDFDRVNVQFSLGDASEVFSGVQNANSCDIAPTSAWYYDDPESPSRIVLCPKTCDRIRDLVGGNVEILFGCATIIV